MYMYERDLILVGKNFLACSSFLINASLFPLNDNHRHRKLLKIGGLTKYVRWGGDITSMGEHTWHD